MLKAETMSNLIYEKGERLGCRQDKNDHFKTAAYTQLPCSHLAPCPLVQMGKASYSLCKGCPPRPLSRVTRDFVSFSSGTSKHSKEPFLEKCQGLLGTQKYFLGSLKSLGKESRESFTKGWSFSSPQRFPSTICYPSQH